jgi:hypothetical protein
MPLRLEHIAKNHHQSRNKKTKDIFVHVGFYLNQIIHFA